MRYSVLQWGSHPDLGNDDCHTGEDFDDLDEALKAYQTEEADPFVEYIEIDGLSEEELHKLNMTRLRRNPNYSASVERDSDEDWRRARAMQAGMGLGIDAYNEEMGYD